MTSSRYYLDVPYKSKDAAKALGARFDGTVKRWYVEAGIDLVAFTEWLPAGTAPVTAVSSAAVVDLAPAIKRSTSPAVLVPPAGLDTSHQGIPLSRLLNSVSTAVAQAFAGGVWTLVEVSEATIRNGHVYFDLCERDSGGQLVAKARAMIWASTATRLLPEFERATGVVIAAGLKLLVRARPVFKSQYGFSLEIDAIDAAYTLGDLEAHKKEIRTRLQQEGVFEHNRRLPPPWDYRLVLVVAPQDAAGLGDFRKEAERLSRFGVCRFVYAHSRFQGEGAAREIVAAARAVLAELTLGSQAQAVTDIAGSAEVEVEVPTGPDAMVIIRGGGAVNDLAWLDDYELARFICDQTIPVLTGIGHARDNTLADEVAHLRFDTPSKVIAGIEQHALRRAQEARTAWEGIHAASSRIARDTQSTLERQDAQIRTEARDHLARARRDSTAALHAVSVSARQQVHDAARASLGWVTQVHTEAAHDLAIARQQVPGLLSEVRFQSLARLGEGRGAASLAYRTVLDGANTRTRAALKASDDALQRVTERATGQIRQARVHAQALMREIAGQGPEKTLERGFVIVRTESGQPVTSSTQVSQATALSLQFHDGRAAVRPQFSSDGRDRDDPA